jgi:signal transduction histidine kinase
MAENGTVAAERLRSVLQAVAEASSDLALDGVLDRILLKAGALVDAQKGYFDVLDRRADRRIGTYAVFGMEVPRGRTARQLLVELMTSTGGHPVDESGDASQPMAFLGVPIKIQDFLFGNMYLFAKRDGVGFTAEDEEIAGAFASAAGVVIENARLYEEGQRQRKWLEAAAEITTTLLSPITRPEALQLVTERAREVSSADFAALLMPRDESTLVVEAVSGVEPDGILGEPVDAEQSLAGMAGRTRQTVVVPDSTYEARYRPRKTTGWPDLGSFMVLPLHNSENLGVLIVGWLRGHRTDRWELDPAVPQQFADQAALALQVARAQSDQAKLAVFEDRDRIGRDLHDLVIQRLFGIGLMLDNTTKLVNSPVALERMSVAIDDIDETIKDIRRTIFALSMTSGAADIRAEIENAMTGAARLLGFTPELRVHGPIDTLITGEVREHLIAVLGEALSNIIRHAKASHVSVTIDVGDGVELTVRDDGRGIGDGPHGNGLKNIRERASLLGGTSEIVSSENGGTTIKWTVPRSQT